MRPRPGPRGRDRHTGAGPPRSHDAPRCPVPLRGGGRHEPTAEDKAQRAVPPQYPDGGAGPRSDWPARRGGRAGGRITGTQNGVALSATYITRPLTSRAVQGSLLRRQAGRGDAIGGPRGQSEAGSAGGAPVGSRGRGGGGGP